MSVKPTAAGIPQKRLNFDVPEELANDFKAYAAIQGKSQREIIVAFMQRCTHRQGTRTRTDGTDGGDLAGN